MLAGMLDLLGSEKYMDDRWTDYAKGTLVPTPFRGLRVLLVDHDTTTLLHISSVLEQHYYRVTTAELATAAVSVLHKGIDQFDLIMADVNMTEMDVFAFLKVIQLLGDIPIILMSAREDRDMAWKARAEGVCFVFQKPMSTEQLKNVWQHVHQKRRCPKEEPENQESERKIDTENDPEDGIVEEGNNKPILENVEIDQVGKVNIECVGESSEVGGGSKRKRSNANEGKRKCERSRNTSIERKEESEKEREDRNDEVLGSSGKKWGIRWTPDLHRKFTDVISAVGERACPKKVLQMMNVPHITPRQVASHLQKYRVQMKRAREALAGFNKYAENGNAFKQTYQQDDMMKLPVAQTFNSDNANAPGLQNPLFGSVLCNTPSYSEHAGHTMEVVPRDNEVQEVSSHLLNISAIEQYLMLHESPVGNNSIKF